VTWSDLFSIAAGYDVMVGEIGEALARRREARTGGDGDRDA